ncbi:MAG: hypothetical protein WB611_18105 [Stellaceae bacterium]
MRSLWRMMAARWLGGDGSGALTGDTGLFDTMMQTGTQLEATFLVRRQSEVSHEPMMSQQIDGQPHVQTPIGHLAETDREV